MSSKTSDKLRNWLPPLLFAILLAVGFVSPKWWGFYDIPIQPYLSSIVGIATLVVSLVTIILAYLQHGAAEGSIAAVEQVGHSSESRASVPPETDSPERVPGVEELFRRVELLSSPFTDEQRVALAKAAADAIATTGIASKIEEVAQRVGQDFRKVQIVDALERNTVVTLARLNSAIPDLRKRGNLNLAIGIAMTTVGVAVLALSVFVTSPPAPTSSATVYLAHLLPRISLALLIEVFAYFFLRLYKEDLAAIALLQNEMTNVEVARSALVTVILGGDADAISRITTAMAALDRNRVLLPSSSAASDITVKSLELLNQAVSIAKSAK